MEMKYDDKFLAWQPNLEKLLKVQSEIFYQQNKIKKMYVVSSILAAFT